MVIGIFCSCHHKGNIRWMLAICFSEHTVFLFIYEIKQHFLPFRRKSMDFVQKQHTSIWAFQQTFSCTVCTCIGAFYATEKMREQQLCIICIIGTVENNELPIFIENSMFFTIHKDFLCEQTFTDTAFSQQQGMKCSTRIQYAGLCGKNGVSQASVKANQLCKRVVLIIASLHIFK